MDKKDIPQDPSLLDNFTTEVCYVTDESGKYTTTNSRGWEVKATALDVAWEEIEKRLKEAFDAVENKKASPILFYMEKKNNGHRYSCFLHRILEMAGKASFKT